MTSVLPRGNVLPDGVSGVDVTATVLSVTTGSVQLATALGIPNVAGTVTLNGQPTYTGGSSSGV